MVASMVAPKLGELRPVGAPARARATTTATPLGFLELLAQPLQATTNGAKLPERHLGLLRHLRVARSRRTRRRATIVERQLTATAALGITTVVAAGDTRLVGVRARRLARRS